MQELINIYPEYKQLPHLIDLGEGVKEDNLKNEQTFLNEPTIKNLIELIEYDLTISHFCAERFLGRLLLLKLQQIKSDKVTLLKQPQIVAFEDLKEGDIYLEDFSNILLFISYTESALLDFSTSVIEEKFKYTIEDVSRESNIYVLGKFDLN